MRVEVRFTIPEAASADLIGATAVVVDVLRATTTLTTALSHGARAVFPAASTEDALRLAQSLGREDTLLCGERKGLRIEGYDLGNSPREYARETVEGKRLIMNTTNGTRAFLAVEDADAVVALSFLNLGAVASEVRDREHLLILCAGREDAFALEDAVCAGLLLQRLQEEGVEVDPDDGARAALSLARSHEVSEAFLASTQAGQALNAAGLGGDLEWCARVDALATVPAMKDRTLAPLSAQGR
ncbi:MAG TPA: 2-phosphosulfolactate phosphatase [Longimicrobiales bacterium]|nr:2-phosphosulfolactate phosphatase [Longimicrobiales bacterium]